MAYEKFVYQITDVGIQRYHAMIVTDERYTSRHRYHYFRITLVVEDMDHESIPFHVMDVSLDRMTCGSVSMAVASAVSKDSTYAACSKMSFCFYH